jgi:hypothetical protein
LFYTLLITTGAKSSAGIPLASNYVWNFTTSNVVVTPPHYKRFVFGVWWKCRNNKSGLLTVVDGAIGTTAASTLVTGFTDGTSGDVYTVTPLNNGLVTDGIFTDAPMPGNATKASNSISRTKCSKRFMQQYFSSFYAWRCC